MTKGLNIPGGVAVMVTWNIKPERADNFVRSLAGMFPIMRTHPGFRSIRLVRGEAETDTNKFLLFEEWDEVENFNDYGRFRVDTGDTAFLLNMTVDHPQVTIWSNLTLAKAEV